MLTNLYTSVSVSGPIRDSASSLASSTPLSAANYLDLSRRARRVEALAATTNGGGLLMLPDGGVQVSARRVTGNLFPMLRVTALHGRLLTPEDDVPSAPLAAVMSEEFWRERLGADPSVVGRTVRLKGLAYTVVGITSREFRIPNGPRVLNSDLWLPMRFTATELGQRGQNFLSVIGRLAPGATPEAAEAELGQLFDAIVQRAPQLRGQRIRVLSMYADATAAIRTQLVLLLGAVGIVFLIAATNVTSLLLARAVHRQRELAIRSALGASRAQMMRPGLVESAVLAGAGLALGLALAWVGVRAIAEFARLRLPQIAGLTLDARVTAFAVTLALVVLLLCGGLPTWRTAAVDPQDVLRLQHRGGTSRTSHRALKTLVVIEVALSLVLLLSAGLAFRGFERLISKDPGFDPARILTLAVVVSPDWCPDGDTTARILEPVLAQIRQRPSIEAAGMISSIP